MLLEVGFEEIIVAINNGGLITIEDHNNQARYPNQKIMYVQHLDTVFVVPFVLESDGLLFLKTLFPSRKATKVYLLNR